MVGFRDWLRTHDEDRALYERTKRELRPATWRYVQNYADAKTDVVEEIMRGRACRAGTPARIDTPPTVPYRPATQMSTYF